jgi:DNA polymerase-1
MRLLSADYSQIELRILAHVTGDPELTRAFAAEEDIHLHTASRLFDVPMDQVTSEMRRRAKTINFAVIYGMSDYGLSRELGIPVKAAREMIDAYFARFPGVVRFTEETLRQARRDGFVCTLMGRKRRIPEINAADRNRRQNAERAAVNAPIQGTAADIIKRAMIQVDAALRDERLRSRMILQVHDELLFEGPPEELEALAALVRREMEGAFPMDVPLRVEVRSGENWRDMRAHQR